MQPGYLTDHTCHDRRHVSRTTISHPLENLEPSRQVTKPPIECKDESLLLSSLIQNGTRLSF